MTTYIILAGGKSSRMGQDKALMLRGTNRIYHLCKEIGASRIITLCGDKSRIDLFEGEVWPDPVDVFGVLDTIKWCLNNIDGETQIIPCDAFNLEKEGINWLKKFENATPVDGFGNRQPLMSFISNKDLVNFAGSNIRECFAEIPSAVNERMAAQFNNFNTRGDLTKLD